MRVTRWGRRLLGGVMLVSAALGTAAQETPAEAQYRIARRLAAEGSSDAAAALQRVIDLDPAGPLADDALVDRARLHPVPEWPEQLGRIDLAAATDAQALLEKVVQTLPSGDRAAEARYHLGLLRMEPLPGRDLAEADVDLLTLASSPVESVWRARARYAGAWLDERQGKIDRATAAYQRLVIDATDPGSSVRARVGLARLALSREEFGNAATWLQDAIQLEAPFETGARGLREQSVRALLTGIGQFSVVERPETLSGATGIRSAAGVVPLAGGGAVIGDQKTGELIQLGEDGTAGARWTVPGLQVVAGGPGDTVYAVSSDSVVRLLPDGGTRVIAPLGEFSTVSAMAVDALSRFWLVDKKGDRVARVGPGKRLPTKVWEDRTMKLTSIAWDGRRIVASDQKSRGLITIAEDGTTVALARPGIQRPDAIAADHTGRIAVVDGKAGLILFTSADGERLYHVFCRSVGILRPTAVAFDIDGALQLFDESNGSWSRFR